MAMMGLDLRWHHTLLVDQDFWGGSVVPGGLESLGYRRASQ